MDQGGAIIAEARSWIGTPFRMGARVKGAGVDCGQFLVAVYGACGFPVPGEVGHFTLDWHLHTREERYLDIIRQYTRPVDDPRPGDIAMFRMGRVYSHGAVIAEWPHCVIQAKWGAGVEYADASQPPLSRHAVLFLRPSGLA